jgi:hypothetical protein
MVPSGQFRSHIQLHENTLNGVDAVVRFQAGLSRSEQLKMMLAVATPRANAAY